MTTFWTVWGAAGLAILSLATFIEFRGGRTGFQGANGLFLFASGYLTVLTSPIFFIVSWVGADFWTAARAFLIGALAYGALFALALRLVGGARASRKR